MEQVFRWLLAAHYPAKGVDWLRQQRAIVIVALAILCWLPIIGLLWLLFALIF